MKNLGLIALLSAGMMLAGCLENGGTKEIPAGDLNNGDFSVVTEPEDAGSSASPSPAPTPAPAPTYDGFDINKGEALASSESLQLDFYPPFHSALTKVSENDACVGGTWVEYTDSSLFASSKSNQKVALSVQFRDHDGRTSGCYVKSIIIDQVGPEIVFAKYPSATSEEGFEVEIVFTVSDAGAGVSEVTCQLGPVTKTCSAGLNKITLPKMASGEYTFVVTAKDKFNFSSQKSVSFSVSSLYKQMAQSVKVNEYKKVDILFVIDNSGSMAYEQKSMASRVRNFLEVVKGLDWQIAVTTTDPVHKTLGDGRLVPLYGKANSFILNSTMADADARYTLGMTLQRPEVGSGSEQGIFSAYRAVERSVAAAGSNTNFIRTDSQLAVVLISDEDESANGPKNDPANFVKYVQTTFAGQKAVSFHSIIAKPNDKACLGGQGASAGYRYEQISKLTGGVIGDVCATDYAAQVQGIAEGVRKTLKSLSLTCAPVIDTMRSLLVLKDGQVYSGTHKVEGLNLVFDEMLPAGNYEVFYSCLK